MSSDWVSKPLSEVIDIISGGTPKTSDPSFWNGGIPWLSIVDFNNGNRYVNKTDKHITEAGLSKSATTMLQVRDIIISARGTVGVLAQVGKPMAFNQSCYGIRGKDKLADTDFIYYVLKYSVQKLKTVSHGAVFDTITKQTFDLIDVMLPSYQEQERIAGVLGCLDDRIALLRETNATLETITQTLFKSWFVDFDPVHAKQQGREPEGMDADTAEFFPDSFEESELGLVPRGWLPKRIDTLMKLSYGKALKADDRIAGEVPVYGSGGITGYHNESLVNDPSIIVGRKGTVGSLYWEDQPFFPIDTVFYIHSFVPMTYCFYLLQTLGLRDMNTDAAVPGLNRNNVYRLMVPCAAQAVVSAFDGITRLIRDAIFRNSQQAQTLATLRDTLLPRLISGQLRLPEAVDTNA